jgi:hypothetical protein
LFEDWQVEYIKSVADRHDLSFSEICRMLVSIGIDISIAQLHPEYKLKIERKNFTTFTNEKTSEDVRHQLLSKLYFETRKAVEYRLSKIKPRKH